MSYWLHEEAETELSDAASYYAENASKQIGEAFLDESARTIDLLEVNPRMGAQAEAGLRAYPLRRFPYTLIYREDQATGLRVFAIAHQSRRPGYWKDRD